MNAQVQARSAARAAIFKALGHPARLYMVEVLAKGEHCVCELTDLVGMDTSTVSRHLRVLKGAGIVKDESGASKSSIPLRIPCILNLFGCIETVLESNAKDQMAVLKEA